ncbi:MAG TPA: nuclear transport factor 2 family protein [Burkholderiaceae bacterium]
MLLAVPALAGAAPATPVASLDPALDRFAHAVDSAWNDGDAVRITAFYAPEATLTLSPTQLRGKESILAFFTQLFKNRPAGFTHRTVVTRVEQLDGTILTDNAVYIEKPAADGGKETVREFFTVTMLKPTQTGHTIVGVRSVALVTPVQARK